MYCRQHFTEDRHHEQNQQNSCNTVFPRDIVCLRNISINTLHKGDYNDDDNNNNNNNNNNVIKKEAEKILKYKDLTTEIQRMWIVKTKVIPVIIGATGAI